MANTPVTDASSNAINSAILQYQNYRRKADADMNNNIKKVREAVTRLKNTYQENEKHCNNAFQSLVDLLSQPGTSNSLTLPPKESKKSGLRSQTGDEEKYADADVPYSTQKPRENNSSKHRRQC
jgi:hypothetical protein